MFSFLEIANAEGADTAIDRILGGVTTQIVNPLISLIFALALIYFLYGVFVYMRESDSDEKRTEGGKHILWGSVGMFIMVSVYGIIRLIMATLNIPPY